MAVRRKTRTAASRTAGSSRVTRALPGGRMPEGDPRVFTMPPRKGADDVLVELDPDEPQAIRTRGVYVSPGEVAWIPAGEAATLIGAGRARELDAA